MKQIKLKPIPDNTVVHTPTEEEAKELLAILHENGYAWMIGANLIDNTYWNAYKTKTCYKIHDDKKYVSYSDNDCYEHNGDTILTLAEFKRMYCEEEKPQPKFKVDDCVINKWGRIIGMRFHEEAQEWEYNIKVYPKGYTTAFESNLSPYTEPQTKDETMEAKELNLCELLKGRCTTFYSPMWGDTDVLQLYDVNLRIAPRKDHATWLNTDEQGKCDDDGICMLWPSRALYEQYPLDPYTAWMVWQQEQTPKYFIQIEFGSYNREGDFTERFSDLTYFRTPADRGKCIEEIKAIIEKYNKK